MKKVFLVLACSAAYGTSHALVWGFSAPIIDGSQEVPPTGSSAYGTASFTLDDVTWELAGSMTVIGIPATATTGSHIHQAPAGVNGPVIFNLLANQIPGSPLTSGNMVVYAYRGTLATANNAATLAAMIAGDTYINVHTPQFLGGEIRGQITCHGVVPEPATIAALSLGVLPFLRRRKK